MRMKLLLSLLMASSVLVFGQTKLEILSATYGTGLNVVDLTDHLRGLVRDNVLAITVDTATLQQDPAPGTEKTIRIRYRFGSTEELIVAKDFDSVRLPKKGGFSISELSVDRGGIPPPAAAVPAPAVANDLRIVAASYGFENRRNDVRDRVEAQVRDNRASFKVGNAALGADPAVGKTKNLEVTYVWQGQTYKITQREDRTINIPDSNATPIAGAPAVTAPPPAPAPAAPQGLQILAATYGFESRKNDVRERVASQVNGDRASFKVTNALMGGDPAIGKAKTLEVTYAFQGQTYTVSAREDSTITIPDSRASAVAPSSLPAPVSTGPAPGFDNGRPAAVRIFSARYVRGADALDVRPRIQQMLANDRLSVNVNPGQLGVSGGGYLVVRYEYKGRTFERSASDGQTLSIP